MSKTKKEHIYIYENWYHSLKNDATTFGFICFTFWFNYSFCGGSYFLNGLILFLLGIKILSFDTTRYYLTDYDLVKKKKLNTRPAPLPKECEEAIEWLDPHIDYLKEMTDETRDSFLISEHWATIRATISKPNGVS